MTLDKNGVSIIYNYIKHTIKKISIMLKTTKGLEPEGITTYVDDKGNEYVRVKMSGEDFCITLHDYARVHQYAFAWKSVMELLKEDGLTLFTEKQVELCADHIDEINNKLKEIGGEAFKNKWYWTSTESGNISALTCLVSGGCYDTTYKCDLHKVRPILNL